MQNVWRTAEDESALHGFLDSNYYLRQSAISGHELFILIAFFGGCESDLKQQIDRQANARECKSARNPGPEGWEPALRHLSDTEGGRE